MLERWERTSGAQFEAEKTSFIHLTRFKEDGRDDGRDANTPLQFKGKEIKPAKEAKILGVTLGKELRFKAHLAEKVGKAINIALALRRLKGLPLKSFKQLAMRSVLPVADYAPPIWYPLATQGLVRLLEQA